ncbi:MAG: anti-sigma factor domain-containing protein [Candidatus Dormibacteria bacterium]
MIRRLWLRLPTGRGFTVVAAVATLATIALAVWDFSRAAVTPSTPVLTAYHVTGTTAAPSASGTISYDPGTQRSVVTVKGLAPPDRPGASSKHEYEMWLVPNNGAAVPAAVLTRQPDGNTWAAVINGKIDQYHRIATTVEPDGGSSAPSGTEVLTANVSG